MASRREELEVKIKASDNASQTVDAVAAKLEALESAQASIDVTASDEASEVIEGVGEEVETLDGETAEPSLEAEDEATEVIEGVSDELASIDGEVASAVIEADDTATGAAEDAVSALEEVEDTFTATIEVEGADEAAESTGAITEDLGAIGGATAGSGLAALSAAGFLEIGKKAADAALEVKGIADATGGSLEDTSRLLEVWELAGGSADTLEKNIIKANDKLRESPELAEALGIKVNANKSAFDLFVEAVGALNSGQLTANERLTLATEVFGSRGVLILNDLQTRVGDLGDGMAAVGEAEIITQEDIDAAIEMQQSWDEVEDAIAALQRKILPAIAKMTTNIAGLLDSWPVDKLISGFDILGTKVSLLESLFGTMGNDAGSVASTLEDVAAELETLLGLSREEITFPLIEAWRELKDDLADNGEVDTATDALAELAEAADLSEDEVRDAAQGLDEEARAALDAAIASEDHASALEDQITSLENIQSTLEDARDAQLEYIDATREATDNVYAARDAERDFRDQVEDTNDTLEEHGEASDDGQEALDDLAQAAQDAADAQVDLLGDTATATQKIDAQNTALLGMAGTLDGAARTALLAHILRINGIPEERATEILTDTNPDDLAQVEDELANASRTRTAAIKADAQADALANVEAALANLTRTRYVPVVPVNRGGGGGRGSPQAVATGVQHAAADSYLVGEQGPEMVELPTGARVTGAGQTAEALRHGGGGQVVNNYTTVNVPVGTTARDVARQYRRNLRVQGAL